MIAAIMTARMRPPSRARSCSRILPPDWRQKIKAANPDADAMQFYFEGKYEVSKRQWDAVMGGQCMDGDALPALSPEDARPVVEVSWHEAQELPGSIRSGCLPTLRSPCPAFRGRRGNDRLCPPTHGSGMGVRGAALATILSQALSCTWVLAFLFGKKTFLKIKASNLKLTRSIIMPSLALGLSTFIMQSSESVISVCFNSSLLKYGGDIAVGAMTILTSVMQFAMLPLQGLGQGAQPIISYNYGAKLTGRVRSAYKLLLALSLSYASLLWLGVMLAPQAFAAMFTSDPALIDFTKHALRIYMACMFLFGIQMACRMTFTAIGNAKASILVAVMRKFILLLPLIYLVPKFMPSDRLLPYIWQSRSLISLQSASLLCCSSSSLRRRSEHWKSNHCRMFGIFSI